LKTVEIAGNWDDWAARRQLSYMYVQCSISSKIKEDTVIEKQTGAGTGTKTQRIGLTERKRECTIFLRWHDFRQLHSFAFVVVIHTH